MSVIHPDITVGPPNVIISSGFTVLSTDPDGQIAEGSEKGLYFRDTRMISSYRINVNGKSWELLNAAAVIYFGCQIFLTNSAFEDEGGEVPRHTVALQVGRTVDDGLHEDFDLTNHGKRAIRLQLELKINSDFADIFEVKKDVRPRRGSAQSDWSADESRLTTMFENERFRRGLIIRTKNASSPVSYTNGALTFDIGLEAGASWHACVVHTFDDKDGETEAPSHCVEAVGEAVPAQRLGRWVENVTKMESSNEELYRLFRRGVEDIAALRLPIGEKDDLSFVPAGGVPWFAAIFGRDSLIASLQTLHIFPDFARGTLDLLGSLQAHERDDFRDAEPGRIAHEMRQGELAQLGKIPHTPYFGTADATPLYLILLHDTWRWCGDTELLRRHIATAEACLAWIDDYGDRDGDGFQEYGTRSPEGIENQGWKDSDDSILYPDGSKVRAPKALCELQGYVYDAWVRMAVVYDTLGDARRARALRAKATDLFDRFNRSFWDEDLGFYVLGLDADKKPIRTIASNAGHCLWSGIVPPERAARVVERLMRKDMWSGWGVRTLSADHPAYNPLSYHNGSVWPHDNGILAMGFKRYGHDKEAAQVVRALSEAASYFALQRLPELFAGIQRNSMNFPVQYLGANVPQAWSAGSIFFLVSALLGLEADAPARKLYVDPVLPHWLPDLVLRDLFVGNDKLSLRFRRDGDDTVVEVLDGDAGMVERRHGKLHSI